MPETTDRHHTDLCIPNLEQMKATPFPLSYAPLIYAAPTLQLKDVIRAHRYVKSDRRVHRGGAITQIGDPPKYTLTDRRGILVLVHCLVHFSSSGQHDGADGLPDPVYCLSISPSDSSARSPAAPPQPPQQNHASPVAL